MPSLIEELQRDALDRKVPVTSLLQKCLVVARKLNVQELSEWALLELDGYGDVKVPRYRKVTGSPRALNPYRGHIPIMFANNVQEKRFSSMDFNQPISEIEHHANHCEKTKTSQLSVAYNAEVANLLMSAGGAPFQPSLFISSSQLQKIIEAVRRQVLDWSLNLEQAGVSGDGLSFTAEEKQRAQKVTYNINIQGDVTGSQIGTVHSKQRSNGFQIEELKDLIAVLRSGAKELNLQKDDALELDSEIRTLEAQANSPKPKESIIRQSFHAIAELAKDAASSTAKALILSKIKQYTGLDVG